MCKQCKECQCKKKLQDINIENNIPETEEIIKENEEEKDEE